MYVICKRITIFNGINVDFCLVLWFASRAHVHVDGSQDVISYTQKDFITTLFSPLSPLEVANFTVFLNMFLWNEAQVAKTKLSNSIRKLTSVKLFSSKSICV